MKRTLFSTLLILTMGMHACKPKDEYKERVAGIVSYLHKEHNYSIDDCTSVLVLQANKCNVCNAENLQKIAADKPLNKTVFILSAPDDSITAFINSTYSNQKIFIDEKNIMPKYGLSFIQNLRADICHGELQSYHFY